MNTIIKDYPGRVTVQVDGVAASAATVVAVAADVLRMQETAYFMIHDPLAVFFLAMLNIEELSRMVDSLKAVKEGIVNAYETRSGLSRTRISNLMTEETWMDAQRAVDLGFADEILRGEKPQIEPLPENAAVVNALRNFMNVPESLKAKYQPIATPVNQSAVEPEANELQLARLRAEVKLYK
jgi:ATP-dependent Clp protease protease subunit